MKSGNKASDGGHLIFTQDEVHSLVRDYPNLSTLFKKLVGAREFIQGKERYCIWLSDEDLRMIEGVELVQRRLSLIREVRAVGGDQSQSWAESPHKFVFAPHVDGRSIFIPSVSSERRLYIPCGVLDGSSVIVAPNLAIYEADLWIFSVLTSYIHALWAKTVGGRLKTDYRYSNSLTYNSFPCPTLSDEDKEALTKTAEGILLARDTYFDKTIAELYDPDHMQKNFPELWEAHQRNDEVLETIYNGRPFKNDTERLEHLFARYSAMVGKK